MTRTGEIIVPDKVEDLWRRIEPFSERTPMQHDIWVRACLDVLYPGYDPVLISSDQGAGAFVRTGGACPTLRLVGAEELHEPIEVVAPDDCTASELVSQLLAQKLPIRFGHHPTGTAFHRALMAQAPAHGHIFSKPVPSSPYIELDGSWLEPESRFNSRRRSDFRRMRRRAEVEGDLPQRP